MKKFVGLLIFLTITSLIFSLDFVGTFFESDTEYIDYKIQDKILYILLEDKLKIYDISSFELKELLTEIEVESANSINIKNDIVYLSTDDYTAIYQVNENYSLQVQSIIQQRSDQVVIGDNHLLLINTQEESSAKLCSIYDISNNEDQSFLVDGEIYGSRNIFLDGNYIYTVTSSFVGSYLHQYQFNENIIENVSTHQLGYIEAVANIADFNAFAIKEGNYIYISDFIIPLQNSYINVFFVFDIADPTNLSFNTYTATGEISSTNNFCKIDDKIFLNTDKILTSVDGDIAFHSLTSDFANNSDAIEFLDDSHIAVFNEETFSCFNLDSFQVPQKIDDIHLSAPDKIDLNDEYLITLTSNKIERFSRDDDSFQYLDIVTSNETIADFCLVDNSLFVASDDKIEIYDISDPDNITIIESINLNNVKKLYWSDSFLVAFRETESGVTRELMIIEMTGSNQMSIASYVPIYENVIVNQIETKENKIFVRLRVNDNGTISNQVYVYNFDQNNLSFDQVLIEDYACYLKVVDETIYAVLGDTVIKYSFDESNELILENEQNYGISYADHYLIIDNFLYLKFNDTVMVYRLEDLEMVDYEENHSLVTSQLIVEDGYYYELNDSGLDLYETEFLVNLDNYIEHKNTNILIKNYPNPFSTSTNSRNQQTTISFEISENHNLESANLNIFNVKGQKVKSLFSNKNLSSGNYSFSWNGEDESGNKHSSGVYFYQLSNEKKVISTNKMMIIK